MVVTSTRQVNKSAPYSCNINYSYLRWLCHGLAHSAKQNIIYIRIAEELKMISIEPTLFFFLEQGSCLNKTFYIFFYKKCACVLMKKKKDFVWEWTQWLIVKTDSVQWPQHSFIIHVLSSVVRSHVDLLLLFSQSIGRNKWVLPIFNAKM